MASSESEEEILSHKACGCFKRRETGLRRAQSEPPPTTSAVAADEERRGASRLHEHAAADTSRCLCTLPRQRPSASSSHPLLSSSRSSTAFPSTRSAFYRDKNMLVDVEDRRCSEAYCSASSDPTLDLSRRTTTLLRRKSSGYSSNSSNTSSTTSETRSLLKARQQHDDAKCRGSRCRLDRSGYGTMVHGSDGDSSSVLALDGSCQCITCTGSGCLPKLSCHRSGLTSKWKFTRTLSSHLRRRHPHRQSTPSFKTHSRSNSYPQAYCDEKHDDVSTCLLRLLFADHVCLNPGACYRKNSHLMLNYHLRSIADKMPRSFNDADCANLTASNKRECDVQDGVSTTDSLLESTSDKLTSYLSHRRHAVCETSEDMREKFHEALTSFMTLKALVRYDLL